PVRAAAARKELLDERVLQTEPRAGQALDKAVGENGGVARTFGGFERLGDRAEHELARDCLLLVAAALARRKMFVESTATLCVATTLAAAPARKLKLRVHLLPRRIEVDAQVRERRRNDRVFRWLEAVLHQVEVHHDVGRDRRLHRVPRLPVRPEPRLLVSGACAAVIENEVQHLMSDDEASLLKRATVKPLRVRPHCRAVCGGYGKGFTPPPFQQLQGERAIERPPQKQPRARFLNLVHLQPPVSYTLYSLPAVARTVVADADLQQVRD